MGDTFWCMCKVEGSTEKLFELGGFILLSERSLEVEDGLSMTGCVLDLSVLFSSV